MDYNYLFDDKWVMEVWHNFSFIMLLAPGLIAVILKLIAKYNPNVPTDTIMELVQRIFTKPGSKKE